MKVTASAGEHERHMIAMHSEISTSCRPIDDLWTKLKPHGQFKGRRQQVAGFIDEPLAATVVYSAVLGGWTFITLDYASAPLAIALASRVRDEYLDEPCWNNLLCEERRKRLHAERTAASLADGQEPTAHVSISPSGGDPDAPEHSPDSGE